MLIDSCVIFWISGPKSINNTDESHCKALHVAYLCMYYGQCQTSVHPNETPCSTDSLLSEIYFDETKLIIKANATKPTQ